MLQKSRAPSKNEHVDHKDSAGVTTGFMVSVSPKIRNRIRDKDKKVLVSQEAVILWIKWAPWFPLKLYFKIQQNSR